MKRMFISLFVLSLVFTPLLYSSGDTVRTRTVAPGVVHTEYLKPGPYTIDVLAVEVGNPYIVIETFRPNGLTKTTLQAAANDSPGHRVVGAVNADFFSFETGWPTGNQVARGMFVQGTSSSRSHALFGPQNKPFIERISFRGIVKNSEESSVTLTGSNRDRGVESVILYTHYRGNSTGTDASGSEFAFEYLDPPVAGDTVRIRIISESATGNTTIPAEGGVISAGSSKAAQLSSAFDAGDTAKLYTGFSVQLGRIQEAIAGSGRILLNGRAVYDSMATVEGIGADFITARHPRTFVGFNKDSTVLFLCTVDGRQTSSIGMNFAEMASFLLSIGAWNAFNLDGGGSTTMVVRNEIVNSPSDPAGERSVANTIQVVSIAPQGTLHHLAIEPKRLELFQGGSAQFSAEGFDEYYNPLSIPEGAVWSNDSRLGTISLSGYFTAAKTNDSGWVKISWNDVSDSAYVVVRTLQKLVPYPTVLNMVPGERLTLMLRAKDTGGRNLTLLNQQASFLSSSPALNVDANGLATATGFGEGTLTVTLDTFRIEIPFSSWGRDTATIVEQFKSDDFWSSTLRNTDTSAVKTALETAPAPNSSSALHILFNTPPTPLPSVLLSGTISVSSRPDSIFISTYGIGTGDSCAMILTLTDKDGEQFIISGIPSVVLNNQWRFVSFRLNRATPVASGILDFPITLRQLRIDLGKGVAGPNIQGELWLDNISAHYPNRTVAPQILFDFESGTTGWYTPQQANPAQQVGIIIAQSSMARTGDVAYRGSYSGKWVFVDDPNNAANWDVRMTRSANQDLGSMLRGSYVGAWVYSQGDMKSGLQICIRDGNGLICAGPPFPIKHVGWKLIGTKLDEDLFTPYLTSGRITDAGNKFNGFRFRALNSDVHAQTKTVYIDNLVTSALTVPTGFIEFTVNWNSPIARLHWVVNSEMSINRYTIERASSGGSFNEIGMVQAIGNTDTTQHYEYVDTPPEGLYQYRIRQITNDGGLELTAPIEVNTITGVVGPRDASVGSYELDQNYPNPFNPSTTIRINLPHASKLTVIIYNVLGQEIAIMADGDYEAGKKSFVWNGADGRGQLLPSGIYFYRASAKAIDGSARFTAEKKMLLLK